MMTEGLVPDAGALERVRPEVREMAADLVALRQDFHRHPERGFEEVRTAGRIVEELRGYGGFRLRTGVAKTGVVADLESGDSRGPVVALRADMDALRVQEENPELDYRSVNAGVMHACGHDGHMAILLGVARVLARHRDRIRGGVRLLFQPAEEGPGGAEPMIAEGALENPRPDAIFGLHLWSRLPTGYAAVREGPMMAFTDEVYFRIRGKGGHGASPHEGIDSILAAAHLILALQSIVSRNVDPVQSAVISIGKIQGGTVMNALAEEVVLDGTQRAFTPEVRDLCTRRVKEVAAGIDATLGTRTAVEYVARYPALVNDPEMSRRAHEQVAAVLGPGRVITDFQIMGGEDMSFFLDMVPGCFLFLGSGNPAKGSDWPHHNPHFNLDEDALVLGVEILLRLTEGFVGQLGA
ncbi:MAG: M20 family metallopeptidase [Candidatus Eisenbacteria bacterium]